MSLARTIALAAVLAAGCITASSEGRDDSGGGPLTPTDPASAECTTDSDCTAAGESCCDCPSFAVPRATGWDESCEDVTCDEPPSSCSTAAACDRGQCVLRCAEVACSADASCPAGFARDAAGCLTCACAEVTDPAAAQCQVDADCVQVPADCCGCAEGGADTAVPASDADRAVDELGCDGNASCPGVDVCDPSARARCLAGSCRLSADSGGGDGQDGGLGGGDTLCGTPELAPCPAGQQCVVNDANSPQASEMGVGVCR